MNVAIHGKYFSEDIIPVIEEIFHALKHHGARLVLSDSFFEIAEKSGIDLQNAEIYHIKQDFKEFDVMLSIGGDGTLLETVTHVGKAQTPILGINTGRLGFLATTTKNQVFEAITCLFERNYDIDNRMLLKVECDDDLFEGLNFGLNEFTVLKQDTSSMINVHAYLNDEFLNSYWADGLIIATPTGSTGYSLSCGGPVVFPHSKNLIITPVSPHNLNVRPLVVSDNSVITLEVEGRSNYFLVSLDSRSRTVNAKARLKICRESFEARLIKFDGYSFVNTLRQKLNWGLDARN